MSDTTHSTDTVTKWEVRYVSETQFVEVPASIEWLAGDTNCIPPFISHAEEIVDSVDGDSMRLAFTWKGPEEFWFDADVRHAPDSVKTVILPPVVITNTDTYMLRFTVGPAVFAGFDQHGEAIYGAGVSAQFNVWGF